MNGINNNPGRAIGCERIVKEKYEIILYLIAQIENVSRAPSVIFASLDAKNEKILALRAK